MAPGSEIFDQVDQMPPELRARWFDACYYDTQLNQMLADPGRSVVALCPPGAGFSTALTLLPDYGLLMLPYDPERWPGQPHAFTAAPGHFDQWMSLIAHAFVTRLQKEPGRLAALNPANYEFVTWLIYRYRGQRQRDTWLRFLRPHLAAEEHAALQQLADDPDFSQFYGDTVSDVLGQIEECLEIAAALGWQGIYASIEISWSDWIRRSLSEREQLLSSLRGLLSALTPLQRPGFGFKLGISTALELSDSDLRALVRGRAVVVGTSWAEPALCELVRRYVAASSAGLDSAPWLSPPAWPQLYDDMRQIWGAPGPAAAVALASQIAAGAGQFGLADLRERLYSHSAPILLDPDRSRRLIWRGMTPLTLDETPFRFFEQLWRDRGRPVENDALLPLAGSQQNLDKNISRIRQRLEPFYGQGVYLYVQRLPSKGTWLERFVKTE